MKKSYLLLSAVIALALVFAIFNDAKTEQNYTPRTAQNIDQEAAGAMEHYKMLRADPETGEINMEDMAKLHAAVAKLPTNSRTKSADYDWISNGPFNLGGRTRALHVYRDDPNQILAGGVSGGLFKSNNNGATWTRLNSDLFHGMVTSVTRLGNGTIYVGSGNSFEPPNAAQGSGFLGHGLFKSTDEGETFTAVRTPDSDNVFATGIWSIVDEVRASPVDDNIVWVAYNGGLATINDDTDELDNKISFGVEDFDISDDGLGIICVRGGDVRVSQDGGESFTNVIGNGSGEVPASGGRKVVAISPDNSDYMYVTTTAGGSLRGVYASINGGEFFDEIAGECGGNPLSFCPFGSQTQGWYDNVLTVVPNQPGSVILGGIANHRWDIGAGSTSTVISGGWNQISVLGQFPGGNDYVHADVHQFTWDMNGILYIGCDGGVFRSIDTDANSFYEINFNYTTTQMYGIAFNSIGNVFGGMQDNGTTVVTGESESFPIGGFGLSVNGGDGFDVEASQEEFLVFVASQFNSLGFVLYDPLTGQGSGGPIGLPEDATGAGNAPFYSAFKFYENMNETNAPEDLMIIASTDLDEGDIINYTSLTYGTPLTTEADDDYSQGDTIFVQDRVQTLFAQADGGRVLLTRNIINGQLDPLTDYAEFTVSGTPLCFEFTSDGDILYIGTTSGRIYRISDLRTAFDVDALEDLDIEQIYSQGVVITDIALDPNDEDRLAASRGSYSAVAHVVYTENASTAAEGSGDDFEGIWNVDGTLANMPAYSVTFDINDPDVILAGTECGIFVTDDLGDTDWEESNTGEIYRVPVYDLRQQTLEELSDGTPTLNFGNLYAGTHGSGIFSAGNFNLVGVDEIESNETEIESLLIYPNPTADVAQVNLNLTSAAVVNIDIFNITGERVLTINQGKMTNGETLISVPVNELAIGNYVMSISIEGQKTQTGKFVVSK